MKTAKPPAAEVPLGRRSQPVRQTRTNPPRHLSGLQRTASGRDVGGNSVPDQPIDIFPAITHFADAAAALPKELVRHFTLLKEVDAKIYTPQETLFKLAQACLESPLPQPRHSTDSPGPSDPPAAASSSSASAENNSSSSGIVLTNNVQPVPSTSDSYQAAVFDQANMPRRNLFLSTASHIKEMLVALEEKIHVISTANEALCRQLARVEDVWPHLEAEFSEEAKWGSNTHWAYPENRVAKSTQNERSRRDGGGAAAISAAAQQLADEAAARSESRKLAVQAKKNQRNNHHHEADSDPKPDKKSHGAKGRKTVDESGSVGLGISTAHPPPGVTNPPPKRRKVEKPTPAPATTDRAMATVFGSTAPPTSAKPKTASPRETPVPEVPKKRKALPTAAVPAIKKRNGLGGSPSVTSSPVLSAFPDISVGANSNGSNSSNNNSSSNSNSNSNSRVPNRSSPAPSATPRPASSRARQNPTLPNIENGKARPSSSASNKPNGVLLGTPEVGTPLSWPKTTTEPKPDKEQVGGPEKPDEVKKESEATTEQQVSAIAPVHKNDTPKPEEVERKVEAAPVTQTVTVPTVTTKSGRASKPSTPAIATFQEAARSRASRVTETTVKRSHKKGGGMVLVSSAPGATGDRRGPGNDDEDDEEGDVDADEPTYCYCNSVSYGSMIACDAEGCEREWFHLQCVGLKVPPKENVKWYCEDCKERLKNGKKVNGR